MLDKTVELAMNFQKMEKNADKVTGNDNIKRMLKRSIAEIVEDRFACFLDECLNDPNLKYYINPWINGIRPDIMIIKDNIIIALIEMKINFGYCRNIFDCNKSKEPSQIHERIETFIDLKNKSIKFKDNQEEQELKMSPNCLLYYITASTENYITKDKNKMIDDYNNFIKKNLTKEYDKYIRFGIVCEEFHDYNSKRVYPSEEEIREGIKRLFKTEHGMNTIIDTIKKCSKI